MLDLCSVIINSYAVFIIFYFYFITNKMEKDSDKTVLVLFPKIFNKLRWIYSHFIIIISFFYPYMISSTPYHINIVSSVL